VESRALGPFEVVSSVPLPSGVVTFLLTDVEGSTRLWEAYAAEMPVALARHDQIISTAVGSQRGVLLKARGEGDSTFSVFARASDAAAAALAAQRALRKEPWPADVPLSVRMALYTGEALERDGDYYGRTVNRAARLRGLASGGQILVSQATAEVIRDHLAREVHLVDLGSQRLPDLTRPEQVLALATAGEEPAPVLIARSDNAPSAPLLDVTPAEGRRLFAVPGIRVGHKQAVHAVVFSPDGSLLATGSDDGTARVVEARTGHEVARVTHPRPVRAVAFSPDGSLLATGSFDGTARVVEAGSGDEVARVTHSGPVRAVTFSPDGLLLATGSLDGTARVVEARTGDEVARVTHSLPVRAVAFSPDGSLLATGSDDATARVVEARTGHELHCTRGKEVLALAFSPDGSLLATASLDGTARLVEARTGDEVARVTHSRLVRAVAFSPDGSLLATASGDGTARLVEERTGDEVARVTHSRLVRAVTFSPDGSLLATASFDSTARVVELRVEN
jgi:WD40 repeat protein